MGGRLTGRASYYAFPAFSRCEMGHLVVSSTQLEGEDGLQVFSLEKDSRLQAIGQIDSV